MPLYSAKLKHISKDIVRDRTTDIDEHIQRYFKTIEMNPTRAALVWPTK